MARIFYCWLENMEDSRIAICQVASGNQDAAIRRAKLLVDDPEAYLYIRSDVGKKVSRLSDHQNTVSYYNQWTLPHNKPEWVPAFLNALTYDEAGDDLIDGSAVTIRTILSSIRQSGAPSCTLNMDPAIVAELARLIGQFCEIRPWTWNDPEEKDAEGNDLPCIIHLEVPGHDNNEEDD